ncbi:hypothetical protein JOM56_007146 [Amanita muscaria]
MFVSNLRFSRVLLLGFSLIIAFFIYLSVGRYNNSSPYHPLGPSTCPPRAYANGEWIYRPKTNETEMKAKDDALKFSGFEGCASSREYYWHLASDKEEQWDRFPIAQSYEWEPGPECRGMKKFNSEEVVRHLVEDGGWLLVGDSVTENHFFSLSCLLYPHVLGSPNYTANPYFDRAWIQHLHLNPESPLVHRLRPPTGFDIKTTPLVSFRRVDLLYSQQELVDIYQSTNPGTPEDFKLFGEETVWTLSPTVYMDQFTAPLPGGNYRTMVVSTAGHWTTTLFHGFRDENKILTGYGIRKVLDLFEVAMPRWAKEVQTTLRMHEDSGEGKRRVVIRAYLPGHEDCHDYRQPWTGVQRFVWDWYNWSYIGQFNEIFEKVLSRKFYPDIYFLPIDRPAKLRPDAHTTGDCLHIMAGAGVLEGWSHYIWHFVTREVWLKNT